MSRQPGAIARDNHGCTPMTLSQEVRGRLWRTHSWAYEDAMVCSGMLPPATSRASPRRRSRQQLVREVACVWTA